MEIILFPFCAQNFFFLLSYLFKTFPPKLSFFAVVMSYFISCEIINYSYYFQYNNNGENTGKSNCVILLSIFQTTETIVVTRQYSFCVLQEGGLLAI